MTVTTAGCVEEYVTLHELDVAVGAPSVQVWLVVPVVELAKVNVTVPVGATFVPAASLSVTVAVQVLVLLIVFTSGLQLTDVVVLRNPTLIVSVPKLVACSELEASL